MKNITAITVCYNSKELIQKAYESFRKFHGDMPLIIIDGSDAFDPCREYIKTLPADSNTTLGLFSYNCGHGVGMDAALKMVKTKYALIFDSDVVFLKSPVKQMLAMMGPEIYGVGYLEKTGEDGFEYGAHPQHKNETVTKYLHPYFMLLQVSEYFKWPPYCHHGAPCFKTMVAIKKAGLSDKILKEFPGLGHSSGKGLNWTGEPREYIQHETAGTRTLRSAKGLSQIEGNWER